MGSTATHASECRVFAVGPSYRHLAQDRLACWLQQRPDWERRASVLSSVVQNGIIAVGIARSPLSIAREADNGPRAAPPLGLRNVKPVIVYLFALAAIPVTMLVASSAGIVSVPAPAGSHDHRPPPREASLCSVCRCSASSRGNFGCSRLTRFRLSKADVLRILRAIRPGNCGVKQHPRPPDMAGRRRKGSNGSVYSSGLCPPEGSRNRNCRDLLHRPPPCASKRRPEAVGATPVRTSLARLTDSGFQGGRAGARGRFHRESITVTEFEDAGKRRRPVSVQPCDVGRSLAARSDSEESPRSLVRIVQGGPVPTLVEGHRAGTGVGWHPWLASGGRKGARPAETAARDLSDVGGIDTRGHHGAGHRPAGLARRGPGRSPAGRRLVPVAPARDARRVRRGPTAARRYRTSGDLAPCRSARILPANERAGQ